MTILNKYLYFMVFYQLNRSEFEKNKTLVITADRFENNKSYNKDLLKGMTYNKIEKPLFTHLVEDRPNLFRPLYENNEFIIILTRPLPYKEFYEKPSKASMSFIHLLVIPKRRIYNAVTLKKEDIKLLNNMKNGTIEYMRKRENRLKMIDALKHKLLFNIKTITKKNLDNIETMQSNFDRLDNYLELSHNMKKVISMYKTDKENFLSDRYNNISYDNGKNLDRNLDFVFHVHPRHSIGHLHLHVILPTELRTNTLCDIKNVPLNIIIDYLNNL